MIPTESIFSNDREVWKSLIFIFVNFISAKFSSQKVKNFFCDFCGYKKSVKIHVICEKL